jgi:hypothetical protein
MRFVQEEKVASVGTYIAFTLNIALLLFLYSLIAGLIPNLTFGF